MEHLIDILNDNTYSKLDHGLTRTDLNPKDKQNYHSCVRIASDDVLSILVKNHTTYGTYVYLLLLEMIINTYVEKTTRIDDRMYRRAKHDQRDSQLLCLGLKSAWCIVVICRLWWIWVQKKAFSPAVTATTNRKRNNKDKFFITRTAYLSVELNAHNLLYIILLVKQRHLPKEALNIFLFNSQSCESLFRNTRSLSGTYSSITNFSVLDFLRRSQKISLLNGIKCDQLSEEDNIERLSFPAHHKHKRDSQLSSVQHFDDIDKLDIEKTISDAFDQALELTDRLGISELLSEHLLFDLHSLSKSVFQRMESGSKMYDRSTAEAVNDSDEFSLDEEEYETVDENDDTDNVLVNEDEPDGEHRFVEENDNDDAIETTKTNFNGIKIHNRIDPKMKDAYFQVKINSHQKFVHKQSACWLLTDSNNRLSNDRLSRVMQTSRKDNNSLF